MIIRAKLVPNMFTQKKEGKCKSDIRGINTTYLGGLYLHCRERSPPGEIEKAD